MPADESTAFVIIMRSRDDGQMDTLYFQRHANPVKFYSFSISTLYFDSKCQNSNGRHYDLITLFSISLQFFRCLAILSEACIFKTLKVKISNPSFSIA